MVTEQTDVAFHLGGHETNELADGVKPCVADLLEDGRLVIDVADDLFHTCRHFCLAVTTVQQPKFVAALCQLSGDGTADGACSTD